MPRPYRICQPFLTYHVMSRCIECRDMLDDDYKTLFLQVLLQTQKKYRFELIHYTIMDNHVHLVIRTLTHTSSISRIMQYCKARFAEQYNRRMHRTGPFWNERFRDVIIEKQQNPGRYFLWLMWYIGFNPVRKGHAASPERYRYSAIQCYCTEKHRAPVIITLHHLYLDLGATPRERIRRFKQWKTAYMNRVIAPFDTS
jgi:putative transposase